MDYIIIGQWYDTGIALYYCPIFLINVLCCFYIMAQRLIRNSIIDKEPGWIYNFLKYVYSGKCAYFLCDYLL